MSLPELSNLEIEQANVDDHSFGGCFSRDDLPSPLPTKYFIVNLDDAKGPGTHWVLLDNRRKHECLYFDSYGAPPPEEVLTLMGKTNKDLLYNDADVQDLSSQQCGWWCEYMSEELKDGADFRKVVTFAQDQPNSDEYLESIFDKSHPAPLTFNKQYLLKTHSKSGQGIFSWFKNRFHFKPRDRATKRFTQFLEQQGGKDIVDIKFGRAPVSSGITKVWNFLSLGGLDAAKKKLKYQDVYHNYLLVTLSDGKVYRIEKNHVVEAKEYKLNEQQHGYNELLMDVPVKKNMNLNTLIQTAEKGNAKFWNYDPQTNNCQKFVNDIVRKNELSPTDPDTVKAILPQEVDQLMTTLSKPLHSVTKTITDIAGVADRIIHGDGVKSRKRKRKD